MSAVVDYLLGGAASTTITAGFYGVVVRHFKRVAGEVVGEVIKDLTKDLANFREKFAAETGGNSNGFRQKLNEVGETVAGVKAAFEQHVKENPK